MTCLNNDEKRRRTIIVTLQEQYGNRMRPEQLKALLTKFADRDALIVEDAVCRHMMDTRPGSDGTPIGRWPPQLADVAYQVAQIEEEARREKLNADLRAREQESDRTYARAMNTEVWREELRRAGQIKGLLAHKLDLDLREPAAMQLVMRVLKAVTQEEGLRHATNEDVLAAAEAVRQEEAARTAA